MNDFKLNVNPCSEDWNKMTPTQKGAFCKSCEKEVVDFSEKSSDQIKEHFDKSEPGATCGRFLSTQLNRVHSVGPVSHHQKVKLRKFAAAVLLVFGTSLFSMAQSNNQPVLPLNGVQNIENNIGGAMAAAATQVVKPQERSWNELEELGDVEFIGGEVAAVPVPAPVEVVEKDHLDRTMLKGDVKVVPMSVVERPVAPELIELGETEIIEDVVWGDTIAIEDYMLDGVVVEVETEPIDSLVQQPITPIINTVTPLEIKHVTFAPFDMVSTPTPLISADNGTSCSNVIHRQGGASFEYIQTGEVKKTEPPKVEHTADLERAKIYPNPSRGNFNISFNSHDENKLRVTVYSMTGAVVSETRTHGLQSGANEISITTQGWPTGIYYVMMETNQGMETRRVVLE